MPNSSFLGRINWIIARLGGVKNASKAFKIPNSTLSRINLGESKVSHENLILIAGNGGIDMNWLISGIGEPDLGSGIIEIPVYDVQLSAGHGDIATRASTIDHLPFTTSFLLARTGRADGKGLGLFEARGDSMIPTIEDKDLVLVDFNDTHQRDGVFAFNQNNQARIKRLQFTFSGTNIMSDNNDSYQHEMIAGQQLNDLHLIGRALLRIGKL